jgi:hypothetical protein
MRISGHDMYIMVLNLFILIIIPFMIIGHDDYIMRIYGDDEMIILMDGDE